MSPQKAYAALIDAVAISFVVVWTAFLLPTIIAFGRRQPDRWLITVTNLILGASGIGWIAALT